MGQSIYELIKESHVALQKDMKEKSIKSGHVFQVIEHPELYDGVEDHPVMMKHIGYLQGLADGLDLTVREMFSEFYSDEAPEEEDADPSQNQQ